MPGFEKRIVVSREFTPKKRDSLTGKLVERKLPWMRVSEHPNYVAPKTAGKLLSVMSRAGVSFERLPKGLRDAVSKRVKGLSDRKSVQKVGRLDRIADIAWGCGMGVLSNAQIRKINDIFRYASGVLKSGKFELRKRKMGKEKFFEECVSQAVKNYFQKLSDSSEKPLSVEALDRVVRDTTRTLLRVNARKDQTVKDHLSVGGTCFLYRSNLRLFFSRFATEPHLMDKAAYAKQKRALFVWFSSSNPSALSKIEMNPGKLKDNLKNLREAPEQYVLPEKLAILEAIKFEVLDFVESATGKQYLRELGVEQGEPAKKTVSKRKK